MGAEHKLDLTSDVTHLLVGDSNTPKYKYIAREREDVKVLRPEWVEAVRQSWMTGESFDLKDLEDHYRFPTFAGLSICVTGFEDCKSRLDIIRGRGLIRDECSGFPRAASGKHLREWS